MKKLEQFLEKFELIVLGIIVNISFLIVDFHEEKNGNSLFSALVAGKYSSLDAYHLISLLVIGVITFYIVRAVPKLFVYEKGYSVENGLWYFFRHRPMSYRRRIKLPNWLCFLFVIILAVLVLYAEYIIYNL